MKRVIGFLMLSTLIFSLSCGDPGHNQAVEVPYVDTGVSDTLWVTIPAGKFYKGMHRHETVIERDYQIMLTDVTNRQFVKYLGEALAAGKIKIVDNKVMGYYKGDPFDGYKHEFEITAGDKVYYPLDEPGVRIKFDGKEFTVVRGFENHPVTFVSWFGANAFAEFYGWRLPLENEWEKAARGADVRTFPWGDEIAPNIANYASSTTLFEKMLGKTTTTTPVGFYNGKTYGDYATLDNRSPFGLYDMAGNVWQWCGDDYPDVHYRYMCGGSRTNYEYNLFVWARNSAGPEFYSMYVGFRCARDVNDNTSEKNIDEKVEE